MKFTTRTRTIELLASGVMFFSAGQTARGELLHQPIQQQDSPDQPKFFSAVDTRAFDNANLRLRPYSDAVKQAEELLLKDDYSGSERACKKAIELSRTSSGRIPHSVTAVLGEIRVAQGRYREARDLLAPTLKILSSDRRDLALVLALCKLGEYNNALTAYEYTMVTHGREEWVNDNNPDRPGARSVRQIEASVLLARAERYRSFRADHGEADLRAAEKLFPQNAMIALQLGNALRDNEKFNEASERYNKAARYGHGELAKSAKRSASGIDTRIRQSQLQKQADQTISSPIMK